MAQLNETIVDAAKLCKRVYLAEQIIKVLLEGIAEGGLVGKDMAAVLSAWEKEHGQRCIFTDGTDYVIATGRGGLALWCTEHGYDDNQGTWWEVGLYATISVWCDSDGEPGEIEGTGCELVEKTAAEWMKSRSEDGVLCTTAV